MIQKTKAWDLNEVEVIFHQQRKSTQNVTFHVLTKQKKVAHIVCVFLCD